MIADDRAIADAFYTVLSAGIVVVAGLAISAIVLSMAGQQSSPAAVKLDGIGEGGAEKGLYVFHYTTDPSSDLSSADPDRILPGNYLCTRTTSGILLDTPGLPANAPSSGGLAIWAGYIEIISAGGYAFSLESTDGSWLWIDGTLIAENHGAHALKTVYSTTMYLSAGRHQVKAKYFYTATGSASCHVLIRVGRAWKEPAYYR